MSGVATADYLSTVVPMVVTSLVENHQAWGTPGMGAPGWETPGQGTPIRVGDGSQCLSKGSPRPHIPSLSDSMLKAKGTQVGGTQTGGYLTKSLYSKLFLVIMSSLYSHDFKLSKDFSFKTPKARALD